MATLQRSTEKGWRIYWRLYFPDGTNKEKYKTSLSKEKLEKILSHVALIEMLSMYGAITKRELNVARNLNIISEEELSVFELTMEQGNDPNAEDKKRSLIKELNDRLSSILNNLSRAEAELQKNLQQNAATLGFHMKEEWERWKKRFVPGEYPDPPPGIIRPTPNGTGIPKTSGIYFVWETGTIVYVGQSINMSNRVRLGQHESIRETDLLSFVPIGDCDLLWAECYYIGMLRPKRNRNAPA